MTKQPKSAVRGGVKGHIVHVAASDRFVPSRYPGNDPRTKAHRRNR